MTTSLDAIIDSIESTAKPEICHTMVCGNENLAVCGEDLTGADWEKPYDIECLVCKDLEDTELDVCICDDDCPLTCPTCDHKEW